LLNLRRDSQLCAIFAGCNLGLGQRSIFHERGGFFRDGLEKVVLDDAKASSM
jgi:hypothetical protein